MTICIECESFEDERDGLCLVCDEREDAKRLHNFFPRWGEKH